MQEDPWALYARLRDRADSNMVNDTYWAIDEALDEVLDRIEAGQPMPTEKQLDTLIGNRRRKLRDRRRALDEHMPIVTEDGSNVKPAAAVRIDIVLAVKPLSERERKLMLDLAAGYTHDEIAKEMKRPVGSVKTWAHRAREKLAA